MVQEFNNILLFGGETNTENMPVGFYSSLAMLPLRGKQLIWWQVSNLSNYGLNNFIIVVCKDNKELIQYIKNVLIQKFSIKLVLISKNKNILSSLKYGLKAANPDLPTRVILGDTLIPHSINEEKDILFSSKEMTASENWCLAEIDSQKHVKRFYDKEKNVNLNSKEILVGYYSFSDTKYLLNCCTKARLLLKKEISTALLMYMEKYKLRTRLIEDWYDLGHTSGLIKAKNLLFNAREFNSIQVDTNYGTLTKSSKKIQKLQDEASWFREIPNEIKVLTPRLINFEIKKNVAMLTQELYGYPSLQELYVSGSVNIEDWNYIIKKLFSLHKKLEQYKAAENKNSLLYLYRDKTLDRINELKEQSDYWKQLFARTQVNISGVNYKGIDYLIDDIKFFAERLAQNGSISVMHGDYCFSNILFDSSNYTFKLIDPRGRLNNEPTIYGDARYDIAKLRHSICGLYDFIVQDLFKLKEKNNSFEYKILTSKDYSILENVFDNYAVKNNFNPLEIQFIEGLLFLSMIPLHKDNIERQKVFYLKAVQLLNNVLNKQKERSVIDERKEIAYMY